MHRPRLARSGPNIGRLWRCYERGHDRLTAAIQAGPGEFEIVGCRGQASALIAVYDAGSATHPTARGLDATSENGRGLGVVALTASRWGHFGKSGRVVWFELCWILC